MTSPHKLSAWNFCNPLCLTCTVSYKLFARNNFVKDFFFFYVIDLADFNLQSLSFGFIHLCWRMIIEFRLYPCVTLRFPIVEPLANSFWAWFKYTPQYILIYNLKFKILGPIFYFIYLFIYFLPLSTKLKNDHLNWKNCPKNQKN